MGGCAPPAVLDVLQPRPRASTCRSSPWHSRAGWQKARRKTKPNATLPPDCANAAFINKAALSCPLGRFLLEQSMDAAITDEAMLTRFRAALDDMYGANLERVVLFGSRARQDAGPDSDYDIAVSSKPCRIAGQNWTDWPFWACGFLMRPGQCSKRSPI